MSTTFDSGESYRSPQLHDKVPSDIGDTPEKKQREKTVGDVWGGWGNRDSRNSQPVAITEDQVKFLVNTTVNAVVERVTALNKTDLIEQYRQFAQLEADLRAARESGERKDAEILALRTHIESLKAFVASGMAPTPGGQFAVTQPAPMPHATSTYPIQVPSYPVSAPPAPYLTVPPYNPVVD